MGSGGAGCQRAGPPPARPLSPRAHSRPAPRPRRPPRSVRRAAGKRRPRAAPGEPRSVWGSGGRGGPRSRGASEVSRAHGRPGRPAPARIPGQGRPRGAVGTSTGAERGDGPPGDALARRRADGSPAPAGRRGPGCAPGGGGPRVRPPRRGRWKLSVAGRRPGRGAGCVLAARAEGRAPRSRPRAPPQPSQGLGVRLGVPVRCAGAAGADAARAALRVRAAPPPALHFRSRSSSVPRSDRRRPRELLLGGAFPACI